MKKFKILSTVLILFFSSQSFAQEEQIHTSVNSLGFEVTTLKELKMIDWNELLTVFEENAPKDIIEVLVGVKDLKLGSKYNGVINNMSVSVSGISKNKKNIIDQLSKKTDKKVKVLERISK